MLLNPVDNDNSSLACADAPNATIEIPNAASGHRIRPFLRQKARLHCLQSW